MALNPKQRLLTVEEFLATDPSAFGPLWRYELIDGLPVGHPAPVPEHGAIVMNLGAFLKPWLLEKNPNCRPESGTAAIPAYKAKNRARIPDVVIRCGGTPVVLFEVVSESEPKKRRQQLEKRRDLRAVEGVQEIVEIAVNEFAVQAFRRRGDLWTVEEITGPAGVLRIETFDLEMPLAELYSQVLDPSEEEGGEN
jgi:Uma2 family endonuclease